MMAKERLDFGALTRRVQKSRFVRGWAILTSATLLQSVIGLASAPILARLFSPDDFGIAGLVQAIGAVPLIMASGQYYLAIGIARSGAEAANLTMLSYVLSVVTSLVLLVPLLYVEHHQEILPESLAAVADYGWAIAAFMVVGSWLMISRFWEIRHRRYGFAVRSRLIETLGITASQVGFGLVGAGPLGLVIGRWLGTAIAAGHGLRTFLLDVTRDGVKRLRWRRIRAVSKRHWRFPFYQMPANVIGEAGRQIVPILLAIYFPLAQVGYYWFAQRLLQRPSLVYGGNLGRVFYQHAADRRRDGKPVTRLYLQSTAILFGTSILPFGVIMLFGPPIFAFVFGAEWEETGRIAMWLALANFVHLIGFPARNAVVLFDLQRIFAISEVLRAVASCLLVLWIGGGGGTMLQTVAATGILQAAITLIFIGFVGWRLRGNDRALRLAQAGATP